jgi:hypothetical protein
MTLLIYYVAIMAVGTIGSILIGLWVEQISPSLSMTVFLCLYFATLWLGWVIAVRITEPKKLAPDAKAGVLPSRG